MTFDGHRVDKRGEPQERVIDADTASPAVDLRPLDEEPTDCGRPNGGRLCLECDVCDLIGDRMVDDERDREREESGGWSACRAMVTALVARTGRRTERRRGERPRGARPLVAAPTLTPPVVVSWGL